MSEALFLTYPRYPQYEVYKAERVKAWLAQSGPLYRDQEYIVGCEPRGLRLSFASKHIVAQASIGQRVMVKVRVK